MGTEVPEAAGPTSDADGAGWIVAAGHVEPHEGGDATVPQIVVARLLRAGRLDDTWGGDGTVGTRLPGGAGC